MTDSPNNDLNQTNLRSGNSYEKRQMPNQQATNDTNNEEQNHEQQGATASSPMSTPPGFATQNTANNSRAASQSKETRSPGTDGNSVSSQSRYNPRFSGGPEGRFDRTPDDRIRERQQQSDYRRGLQHESNPHSNSERDYREYTPPSSRSQARNNQGEYGRDGRPNYRNNGYQDHRRHPQDRDFYCDGGRDMQYRNPVREPPRDAYYRDCRFDRDAGYRDWRYDRDAYYRDCRYDRDAYPRDFNYERDAYYRDGRYDHYREIPQPRDPIRDNYNNRDMNRNNHNDYHHGQGDNWERFTDNSRPDSQNFQHQDRINTKIRLPNFSGKADSWKSFKSQFKLMSFTLSWSEKEMMLQLTNALDEKSRDYIDDCFPILINTTVFEIMQKLDERFEINDPDHYRAMLFKQRFRTTDSILDHTDNLRSLARKAFSSESPDFVDGILKTALLQSVTDRELSKFLNAQRRHLLTIDEIQKAIQNYQGIEGERQQSNNSYFKRPFRNQENYRKVEMVRPASDSESDDDDEEINELCRRIQAIQDRRNFQKKDFNKLVCNHCSGTGHFQRECPSKDRIPALNAWTSSRGPNRGSATPEDKKTETTTTK